MTTTNACKNCGAPATTDYCPAHDLVVPGACPTRRSAAGAPPAAGAGTGPPAPARPTPAADAPTSVDCRICLDRYHPEDAPHMLRDGVCGRCAEIVARPSPVATASMLTPEPGALAPATPHYRLSSTQLAWLLRDLLDRYEVLRAKPTATPERARTWAVNEALDALAPFAERPSRRTPSGDGIATLDRVTTIAMQHQREAYAPAGMAACCVQCAPVSWWLSADSRDAHAAEQHGEAR